MLEIPDEAPDQRRGAEAPADEPTVVSAPAETNLSAPQKELKPGEHVGRYIVLRELGRGGMAFVYDAYDSELDRQVALKIMAPRFADDVDQQGVNRLVREAQAMARLSHPNVVSVYDVGEADGRVFIAMELIHGRTLRKWGRARDRTWPELRDALVAAGRGLAAAHDGGLVHRDFKPDNVLVGDDGRVVVLDFGVARVAPAEDAGVSRVAGTASYMAPEQEAGQIPTPASDQYAFCVAAYELAFGRHPLTPISRQRAGARPPIVRDLPAGLEKALRRGLSPLPEKRWPDLPALLAVIEVDRPRRRRRIVAGVAVGVAFTGAIATAAVTASRATDGPRCEDGRARIAEVWNDEVRAGIEESFERSNLTFAANAWRRTDAIVTAWTEQWNTEHAAACEATHLHATQTAEVLGLRMACLERARDELSAFTTLLRATDDRVIKHAVQAAHRLTAVTGCGDVDALRSPVPMPDDPRRRAAVIRQRRALARAGISLGGGDFEGALHSAVEIADHARVLEFAPLEAEAELLVGRAHERLGDVDAARAAFERAVLRAEAGGHDLAEAGGWIALTRLVGRAPSLQEPARSWADHAAALVERLGHRPDFEASFRQAQGRLQSAQGKHREALASHRSVLELFKLLPGTSELSVARARKEVAEELLVLGDLEVAATTYASVVKTLSDDLGEDHPDVGVANVGYARALLAAGRIDEARPLHEHALAILEAALGSEHPDVADALDALARAELAAGLAAQARSALSHAERARDIWTAARGEDDVQVARAWSTIGRAHDLVGEELQASAAYDRSFLIREAAYTGYHLELAASRHDRGAHELRFGNLDEARRILMGAFGERSQLLGLAHPDTAATELELARLHLRRRDHAAAESAAEHAHARLSASFGPDHASVRLAAIVWALALLPRSGRATAEDRLVVATAPGWRGPIPVEYANAVEWVARWAQQDFARDSPNVAAAPRIVEAIEIAAAAYEGTSPSRRDAADSLRAWAADPTRPPPPPFASTSAPDDENTRP